MRGLRHAIKSMLCLNLHKRFFVYTPGKYNSFILFPLPPYFSVYIVRLGDREIYMRNVQWVHCVIRSEWALALFQPAAISGNSLSGNEHYSHLLFILFQIVLEAIIPVYCCISVSLSLSFFVFVVVVNFNNRDSLQIVILPCILCNSANITLIMLLKLYSCSKSFSNVTIDHGSPFQPPGVLQKTSRPATVSLWNWFEWNQINADHHFSRSRGSKTLESTKMASLHITSRGYFSSTRNKRGKVSDSAQAYVRASVSRWSVSRVIIAYYRILY